MEELLQCAANQAGSSEAPKQGKNNSLPNFPGRKRSVDIGKIEVTESLQELEGKAKEKLNGTVV